MIEQKAADVLFDIEDAIINDAFEGFRIDYLVLHSLIRRYKPKTFFEIGTNMGRGTAIICNAVRKYFIDGIELTDDNGHKRPIDKYVLPVYSLDLPTELAHISLQHPISEGKGDKVGSLCTFPYTQLRGDSLQFDFKPYKVDGAFIDGEHDRSHVWHETLDIILDSRAKLIIWHDADISGVWEGIVDALKDAEKIYFIPYQLYRVTDTRIAYALRK